MAQELTTLAIVRAVDELTGPLGRMAGNVERVQGRMAKGWATMSSKINSIPLFGGGMMAAIAEGGVIGKLIGSENLKGQIRAIGEMTEEQVGALNDRLVEVSKQTGTPLTELLEGAKAWQELGQSIESYTSLVDISAKSSKVAGIAVADQMKAVNALGRAFGDDVTNRSIVQGMEDMFLVGAKGMSGGGHALEEALQKFAPIAAALKLTKQQTIATIQTLGGQFDASTIGTALKSGMVNMLGVTAKQQAIMNAAGINQSRLFQFDQSKVTADSLLRTLQGTGMVDMSAGLEATIRASMQNVDLTKDGAIPELKAKMIKGIMKTLDHPDAITRTSIAKAVNLWMGSGITGLDMDEFFKQIGPLANNAAFMAQLFGKENVAPMMDLAKQTKAWHEHLVKLSEAEGAVDRKWGLFSAQLGNSFDRLKASWDGLFRTDNWSMVKGDLSTMFDLVGGFLDKLSKTDPNVLRNIFWGLTGLTVLPALSWSVGFFAGSLQLLGGAVLALRGPLMWLSTAPLWSMLSRNLNVMGRAALVSAEMNAGLAGAATMSTRLGTASGGLMLFGSRAAGLLATVGKWAALGAAGLIVYEAFAHFDDISAAFDGFKETAEFQKLMSDITELGKVGMSLGGDLDKAANALATLFHLKADDGFVTTLQLMAKVASTVIEAATLTGKVFHALDDTVSAKTDAEKSAAVKAQDDVVKQVSPWILKSPMAWLMRKGGLIPALPENAPSIPSDAQRRAHGFTPLSASESQTSRAVTLVAGPPQDVTVAGQATVTVIVDPSKLSTVIANVPLGGGRRGSMSAPTLSRTNDYGGAR